MSDCPNRVANVDRESLMCNTLNDHLWIPQWHFNVDFHVIFNMAIGGMNGNWQPAVKVFGIFLLPFQGYDMVFIATSINLM